MIKHKEIYVELIYFHLGQEKLIICFSDQFFQKSMRQGGFIFYCFRLE